MSDDLVCTLTFQVVIPQITDFIRRKINGKKKTNKLFISNIICGIRRIRKTFRRNTNSNANKTAILRIYIVPFFDLNRLL